MLRLGPSGTNTRGLGNQLLLGVQATVVHHAQFRSHRATALPGRPDYSFTYARIKLKLTQLLAEYARVTV